VEARFIESLRSAGLSASRPEIDQLTGRRAVEDEALRKHHARAGLVFFPSFWRGERVGGLRPMKGLFHLKSALQ
jgi:hypothetical protein